MSVMKVTHSITLGPYNLHCFSSGDDERPRMGYADTQFQGWYHLQASRVFVIVPLF